MVFVFFFSPRASPDILSNHGNFRENFVAYEACVSQNLGSFFPLQFNLRCFEEESLSFDHICLVGLSSCENTS